MYLCKKPFHDIFLIRQDVEINFCFLLATLVVLVRQWSAVPLLACHTPISLLRLVSYVCSDSQQGN